MKQLKDEAIKIIFSDIKFLNPHSNYFLFLILIFKYKQIQKMIRENEQAPDIEKLELHEFILDVEEHERRQAEADQEVARVW